MYGGVQPDDAEGNFHRTTTLVFVFSPLLHMYPAILSAGLTFLRLFVPLQSSRTREMRKHFDNATTGNSHAQQIDSTAEATMTAALQKAALKV